MIIKLNKYVAFFAINFVLLSIQPILKVAHARPKSLPDPAKVRVAPFRVIELEHQGLKALVQLRYTTVDSPSSHVTAVGGPNDGVGMLILSRSDFTVGCTGTLLTTGRHILTAGHCITDEFGNNILDSGSITFEDEADNVVLDIDPSLSVTHPDWDGDPLRGNDLAILTLYEDAPMTITRSDINRSSSVIGAIGEKYGYGLSGLGNIDPLFPFGTKRHGQNKYDAYADTMLAALGLRRGKDFVRQSVLQSDFDNGLSANDAFDFFFGITGLGLGTAEVNSASGDSGGPTNRVGKIIGVTSYGITLQFVDGTTSDTTPNIIDSSIGEFSGDTNVAKYAAWIDEATGASTVEKDSSCSPGHAKRGLC